MTSLKRQSLLCNVRMSGLASEHEDLIIDLRIPFRADSLASVAVKPLM